MINLNSLRHTLIDGRTKGIPGTTAPFPLHEIGQKGWNVLAEDLPLPLMVLRRSALDHNARVFGEYLTSHGLSFAPHGKTTMSPQIFDEQLHNGAWGMTAATVNQVQVMRHYGVERILMANQLLGKAHVASVVEMLDADPAFDFMFFLDSAAQLDNIVRHLGETRPARPLKALIEIGVAGGRTGLRTREEALDLAEKLAATDPSLVKFAGFATFEGVIPGLADNPMLVDELAQFIVETAAALPETLYAGLDEFILSGGGSSHFDIIADRFVTLELPIPVRVVLRSGCYVTNDEGSYKAAQDQAKADPRRSWKSDLEPALEAWAYVQSLPEPGLAFLSMGKRDVPYDSGLPKPIKRYRPGVGMLPVGTAEVFATNDQHGYVRLGEDADWQIGDLVGSAVSHPCTAFDKWRLLPVVDDDYTVIDGMMTFF
ncbi:amino acid deaminase [Devosia sp.]|uniref:amino acid deaminase n=1 Tax=Devosia sp. TaxID=1871048 RepID=UPI003A8CB2F2